MALQRRTRSTRVLVITLVTASLVTITIDYKQGSSGPLAEVGKAALSVISPMQTAVTKGFRPVSHFFSSVVEAPSLRARNEELRRQIQQYQAQLSQVQSLQYENDQLRTLFNLRSTLLTNMQTTGADVIASGVSN